MPYGFVGNASEKYLTGVSQALSAAASAHSKDPFSGYSNTAAAPPSLPPRSNQKPPYEPDSARSGGYVTGVGNQTNIVSDRDMYNEILRTINMTDEKAAETFYNVAMEIEELCAGAYVVPKTLPRLLGIADAVKRSLGEFRALTDDAEMTTRRFAAEIADIG